MLLSPPMVLGMAGVVLFFSLLAALMRLKRQQTAHRLHKQRIVLLQQKIEAVLNDDGFEAERVAFGVALQAARLTTELQRPRLENMAKIDKQPPEKYRILSKLASQGMPAEEIASILGISPVEANQLLSLSTVARYSR